MSLRFFTAGESHGPELTAILDGFPAGLSVSIPLIDLELARRQTGYGSGGRMKIESDRVRITSGVMDGKSTGAPITLVVKNLDHTKWIDKKISMLHSPRPGHADLTGTIKYGFDDMRLALERASARETTMRVAVGGLLKQLLNQFGIKVGGYVISIGTIKADLPKLTYPEIFGLAEKSEIRCPDLVASEKIKHEIEATIRAKDTLGGVIEVIALGVPPGLGSYAQWDRRLEAKIASALMSVQAIKGVEIGEAWANTTIRGTSAHDPILVEGDTLVRGTNRAGGIEGGVSNGEPIIARAAMKPIATTLTPQETVDLGHWLSVKTTYERSDFCPVPRAVPILESMMAFVIADELIQKIGGDSINEMSQRFSALPKLEKGSFKMSENDLIFWGGEDA